VLSFFRWVLFFIALLVTLMGGALLLGRDAGGRRAAATRQERADPARRGPRPWPRSCEEEGVISHPRLFRIALMVDPNPKPIKAGEYECRPHISMSALVDLLQSGKVVQRRLTVPEGARPPRSSSWCARPRRCPARLTLDVKEGDLLPETYFYSRDDTATACSRDEGGDGEDARAGVAQARRRAALCQQGARA
jgi:UPF0755 protein